MTDEVVDPTVVDPVVTDEVVDPTVVDPAVTDEVVDPTVVDSVVTDEVVDPTVVDPAVTDEVVDPTVVDPAVTDEVVELAESLAVPTSRWIVVDGVATANVADGESLDATIRYDAATNSIELVATDGTVDAVSLEGVTSVEITRRRRQRLAHDLDRRRFASGPRRLRRRCR